MYQHLASHPQTSPHFYSSSGGNAGLACVVAAQSLGYPASVVVPITTKARMIEKIRAAGAEDVIQVGSTWKDADTYLREVVLQKDGNGVYVPPFDAEGIWEGNSSIVDELATQIAEMGPALSVPTAILCSVGGGGLFCGVMKGLDRYKWSSSVIAVETKGADSLATSIDAEELVTLPGISSAATSLGCTRVATKTYEYASSRPEQVKCFVVSDADAARACCYVKKTEGLAVELACGASVAACTRATMEMALKRELRSEDVIVVIVCGGSNVTGSMLEEWRKEFGVGVGNEIAV